LAVARDGRRRPPEVASVGDNCVDVSVDRPGEELAGGNALNVAVELARAGRATGYFGAVGTDAYGAVILDAARAAGVDIAEVRHVPGRTGVTVVARDAEGERQFLSQDYGVSADYRLDEDTVHHIAGHPWAHFARQADLADWAPMLRGEGVRLSCDLGVESEPGTLELVAPHLDVAFFSTSAGGGRRAEELLEEALAAGAVLAVVTCGSHGSLAGAASSRWKTPAVRIENVVDTLGAGDAFIAAFISAVLDGGDIQRALGLGALAGATACTRRGLANPLEEVTA